MVVVLVKCWKMQGMLGQITVNFFQYLKDESGNFCISFYFFFYKWEKMGLQIPRKDQINNNNKSDSNVFGWHRIWTIIVLTWWYTF